MCWYWDTLIKKAIIDVVSIFLQQQKKTKQKEKTKKNMWINEQKNMNEEFQIKKLK